MSESNVKIQKIKKSSNVALILVRFAKVFCIFMSVVTIGSGIGFIAVKLFGRRDCACVRSRGNWKRMTFMSMVPGFWIMRLIWRRWSLWQ